MAPKISNSELKDIIKNSRSFLPKDAFRLVFPPGTELPDEDACWKKFNEVCPGVSFNRHLKIAVEQYGCDPNVLLDPTSPVNGTAIKKILARYEKSAAADAASTKPPLTEAPTSKTTAPAPMSPQPTRAARKAKEAIGTPPNATAAGNDVEASTAKTASATATANAAAAVKAADEAAKTATKLKAEAAKAKAKAARAKAKANDEAKAAKV